MDDKKRSDYVGNAIDKAKRGESLTGNEARRLQRIADGHFSPAQRANAQERGLALPSRTIEEVEGLEAKLRRRTGEGGADGADGADGLGFEPGFTYEEFTICDSGSPALRWIPTWTSDPTPP